MRMASNQPSVCASWKKWSAIQSISRCHSCVAAQDSCAGALSPASKYPGQRRSSSRTTSAGGCCSPLQRLSCPVGKGLAIHVTRSSLVEAIRMHKLRRRPGLALPRRQMGSLVTLRRHAFPLLERRILDRSGFLPLLGALRPAHFGSLVARVSYCVIRTCEERAFLLGQAEDVILDPIFQAEDQRPGLDCFGRERFFGFKKPRTAVLENLG